MKCSLFVDDLINLESDAAGGGMAQPDGRWVAMSLFCRCGPLGVVREITGSVLYWFVTDRGRETAPVYSPTLGRWSTAEEAIVWVRPLDAIDANSVLQSANDALRRLGAIDLRDAASVLAQFFLVCDLDSDD